MIEIANQQITTNHNEVMFFTSDFVDFKTDIQYDVIMLNYVLHHIANPKVAIEKACNLLKEYGIIMITVPGTEYLKETFPYSEDMLDSIGRFHPKKVEDIFHSTNMIQLLYKKSIFLMKFESYEKYIEYLKSIGTYQKIVDYFDKTWSVEYNHLIQTAFATSQYITGHYDMYIYCKV